MNNAQEMLRCLGEKTDMLVCEMPGDRLPGLSFDYIIKNINTGKTYEITNYENDNEIKNPMGKIFLRINRDVPPGKYEISVRADGYEKSNRIEATIGRSGHFRNKRPRIKIEGDKLKLNKTQEYVEVSDLEGVIKWYDELLYNIFDNQVDIIDKSLTDYKGGKRKYIIYT